MRMKRQKLSQRLGYFAVFMVLALQAVFAPLLTSSPAFAGRDLSDKFVASDIWFYDPGETCSGFSASHGGVVTILNGDNVAEKVWNWFASAGIATVSDNPNVIAGIIGNLMTESGGGTFNLNPFVVSGYGYVGLFQAGGGRRDTLKKYFTEAGLDSLWGSSLSSVSETDIDKAVDVTLTDLVYEDDGSFMTFVNHLGDVDADTPEAYSDLFLVVVERAVGGDSPILDSGAKKLSDGGDYQGSENRRKHASEAHQAFARNSGGGSVTTIQDDTKVILCSGGSFTPGVIVSGGMTLEEAKAFMDPYRKITPRNYHEPGGDILSTWHINNVTDCTSDLENCVAFVQYFICEYAQICMGLGNGGGVVAQLLDANLGFIDGGNTPRPYAVFSRGGGDYGHTGVILGVDEERGKVIIGEAGCSGSYDYTNAKEKDLAEYQSSSYHYAYTDNLIGL